MHLSYFFPFVVYAAVLTSYFAAAKFLQPIAYNQDKLTAHTAYKPSKETRSFRASSDPFLGVKTISGYIHAGRGNGQIFYWIVPKDQVTGQLSTNTSLPFALWLQGGPGCSSDFAFFTENGPLTMTPDGTLSHNAYAWNQLADMIYVDQPLGTGFSIADDPCNYAIDEKGVARDMAEFLGSLLHLYPQLQDRPFYITGESYAGHYIPSISHYLVEYPIPGLKLTGVAIGNGWVDPIYQYPAYGKFAYENHMISKLAYQIVSKALDSCVSLIKKKAKIQALVECNAVVNAIVGKKNPYDIRLDCEVPPLCYNGTAVIDFLNRPDVQEKLHVSKKWEECDTTVYSFLLGDFDSQTRTKVQKILAAGIKVLIYHGDKDFVCNWEGGEAWISQLSWDYADEFSKQPYKTWIIGSKPAGQYKHSQNLAFVRVFDAGHMVPMDQPESALGLLSTFLFSDTLEKKPASQSSDFSYVQ